MVYLYRVAWAWYEDYIPYVLIHERRFSDGEWNKIIRDAMNKAVNELLKTDEFIGMDRIVFKVVGILCSEYGFRRAEYVQELELTGSIIIKENDKDEIKELDNYIDTELVNAIIEHNKKIESEIWRKIKLGRKGV